MTAMACEAAALSEVRSRAGGKDQGDPLPELVPVDVRCEDHVAHRREDIGGVVSAHRLVSGSVHRVLLVVKGAPCDVSSILDLLLRLRHGNGGKVC